MNTRQGRRSPDEEEQRINATLKDAGLLEDDMSLEDKRNYYRVIQQSKEGQSPARTTLESPDHELRNSFSKLSTNKSHETEGSEIFADAESNFQAAAHQTPKSPPKTDAGVIVEDKGRSGNRRSLSLGKTMSERSIGRGRAKPSKHKYPSLPINAPGQKSSTIPNTASAFEESENVVRPLDQPQSPESYLLNQKSNQTVLDKTEKSLVESTNHASLTKLVQESEEHKSEIVDVESSSQEENEERHTSATEGNKPSSPVNIEDNGDDVQPTETILLGKKSCEVSPFETLLRPLPSSSISIFIKDLEKYKGDKMVWMKHAKEACQTARYAFYDKLLEKNLLWGSPISDTGCNNPTLFKQTVPKYSKLFGNSPDIQGRNDRQSKIQAMSKINESSHLWAEQDFHSLRRSKQRDPKEDISGNRSQRQKIETFIDDDDCVEYPSGSSEPWPNDKTEQKKKTGDSDSEASPDSPNISGSHDPYEFPDDEIWNTATFKNRNKNNRKGGKLNQCDIEVESKPSPRIGTSTSIQRGSHSKSLRVRKGAISRPSEHGTSCNNAKNKAVPADQFEETNASNNNRWLSSNHIDHSSDIPSQKFYSPKVSQPRNSLPSTMRKSSRESRNPEDFPSSPSTSGGLPGRHHDSRSDTVVEETQCPICCKSFPSAEIEAHSSGCNEFPDDAEGEKLLDEVQSKGGSDKIAKVTSKGESSSSDGENKSTCDKCNLFYTQNSILEHIKECRGNLSIPTSGHKRGNSPERDDGPAKKSSRLMP